MTETLNDCRAAFEAEMKRLRTFSTFMKNDGTGDYCDDYMQTKWILWQAAWNQRPSEISGDEVERVAIAISPWRNGNKRMVDHWPGLREEVKEAYRAQAKAAIAAMSPKREMVAPPGFTLVPNKALEWLFGEGDSDFMPPERARGKYWWRSIFRQKIKEIEVQEGGNGNG